MLVVAAEEDHHRAVVLDHLGLYSVLDERPLRHRAVRTLKPSEPIFSAVRILPEMDRRTDAVLPAEIDQSRWVPRSGSDLRTNAEVPAGRLDMDRGGQLVDVLHHFVAGHTLARVDHAQLVSAGECVDVPVHVPQHLARGIGQTLNGLDRVLRQLTKILERRAVLTETIQQETHVGGAHWRGRAGNRRSRAGHEGLLVLEQQGCGCPLVIKAPRQD